MSSDVVLKVQNIGKRYEIYEAPHHRLLQTLFRGRKQFYKEFWALKDISFEVKKGQCVGIIGRNGSGKSTLLQIIAGTLAPTLGNVDVNGRVSALLELGSGFNPEFTGRENVYMNGAILGLSKSEIDEKFDEIAAFADIGEFIDQPVKIYSSGMYVRLAFAVATCSITPEILIVDEALAVGDFAFQQKCFQRVIEMKKSGCSILLVSHDMSSIVEFCDRAVLLHNGDLNTSGIPKDVVNTFKKLLSNSFSSQVKISESNIPQKTFSIGQLQKHFEKNKNCNEYGDGVISIIDWGITDSLGNPSSVIDNEETVKISIIFQFNDACSNPIAGYFFSDLKGRELVGTNTMYERSNFGPRKKGDIVAVSFTQKLSLAPGVYSLNIGCSEYIKDELTVHHRLYDVTFITIHSQKRFVGFCSLFSDVKIETLESA